MAQRIDDELIPVPRSAIRLPLELPRPAGFMPDDPATWPRIEGQLEYVGGKLFYMPPSADLQQDTSADVVTVLGTWRRAHPDFVVAGNEAGMILGGETRGADAAVWRRSDLGQRSGSFRRVAPLLAVEVQGKFEDEPGLRVKAAWYLAHGVEVVWLVFPIGRRVVAIWRDGDATFVPGQRLPSSPALPGLEPMVDELLEQVLTPDP